MRLSLPSMVSVSPLSSSGVVVRISLSLIAMLVMCLPWRIFVYSSAVLFSSRIVVLVVFVVGFFFFSSVGSYVRAGGWGARGVSGCRSGGRRAYNRRRGSRHSRGTRSPSLRDSSRTLSRSWLLLYLLHARVSTCVDAWLVGGWLVVGWLVVPRAARCLSVSARDGWRGWPRAQCFLCLCPRGGVWCVGVFLVTCVCVGSFFLSAHPRPGWRVVCGCVLGYWVSGGFGMWRAWPSWRSCSALLAVMTRPQMGGHCFAYLPPAHTARSWAASCGADTGCVMR